MKLMLNGFNEDQFRWCFWSSDSENDADSMDSGYGGSGSSSSSSSSSSGGFGGGGNDNGSDDADSMDSGYDTSTVGMGTNTMGDSSDYGGGVAPSININDAINDFLGRPSRSSQYAGQAAYNAQLAAPVGTGTVLAPTTTVAPAAISAPVGTGTVLAPNTSIVNGVPVTRATPVASDVTGYQPTNYGQADLDKAMAQFGSARDAAYADKQFGFDLGPFKGPFGIYEGIADALFDPTASLANALAERGVRSFEGQDLPSRTVGGYSVSDIGSYSPTGLDVVTAGGPLSEGGRVAAYDAQGNLVYDTSPFSGLNPFGEGVPENIRALYDMRNQVEAEQRAMQGEGGDRPAPLLVPEQEPEEERQQSAFPEFKPREYKYQPFTSKFYTIPSRFTRPTSLLG